MVDTKVCFQYDLSGLYLCDTVAWASPEEPGHYLLPARCTFTAPPDEVPAGMWPRWTGTTWDIVVKPPVAEVQNPLQKLSAFLASNPDVAAMLEQQK